MVSTQVHTLLLSLKSILVAPATTIAEHLALLLSVVVVPAGEVSSTWAHVSGERADRWRVEGKGRGSFVICIFTMNIDLDSIPIRIQIVR